MTGKRLTSWGNGGWRKIKKTYPCVFIGYSPMHKGYRCYEPKTKRVYISRHVIFYEGKFLYKPAPQELVSTLLELVKFPALDEWFNVATTMFIQLVLTSVAHGAGLQPSSGCGGARCEAPPMLQIMMRSLIQEPPAPYYSASHVEADAGRERFVPERSRRAHCASIIPQRRRGGSSAIRA